MPPLWRRLHLSALGANQSGGVRMFSKLARLFPALLIVVWLCTTGGSVSAPDAPVYVILWFDTEDYRNHPAKVSIRKGRYTADSFAAEDSPGLWGWVIFPEGFHAPQIMEMARLQAWTLKPALVQKQGSGR